MRVTHLVLSPSCAGSARLYRLGRNTRSDFGLRRIVCKTARTPVAGVETKLRCVQTHRWVRWGTGAETHDSKAGF